MNAYGGWISFTEASLFLFFFIWRKSVMTHIFCGSITREFWRRLSARLAACPLDDIVNDRHNDFNNYSNYYFFVWYNRLNSIGIIVHTGSTTVSSVLTLNKIRRLWEWHRRLWNIFIIIIFWRFLFVENNSIIITLTIFYRCIIILQSYNIYCRFRV